MPYLTSKDKFKVDLVLKETTTFYVAGGDLETAGELNYAITNLIRGYFHQNGGRYQQINDIIGALESAKAEFQRRIVGPYEDSKISENGDVY